MTTPNIAILDFFEHAIEDITLDDTKKGIYDMLIALNKRIVDEFIFIQDQRNLSYE